MVIDTAGTYEQQTGGFKAFVPNPLPMYLPVLDHPGMQTLLSEADHALARLDGVATFLPNPDLFVGMYLKREALLSSQIEGTRASLEGVLEFEADLRPRDDINQIREVINYNSATEHGLKYLDQGLTLDLVRELHTILVRDTRGDDKSPGEFRTTQNRVGGTSFLDADYIPPPPDRVLPAMEELVGFVNREGVLPVLVQTALVHYQFETIHPFREGNGRVGRMLVTLMLCARGALHRPVLCLSLYLRQTRQEYYRLLNKVRNEAAWQDWVAFFLRAVRDASREAFETARSVVGLRDDLVRRMHAARVSSPLAVILLDHLFLRPLVTAADIAKVLEVSAVTAGKLVNRFARLGILHEVTGKERYRTWMFGDYVRLIARGTELQPAE